MSYRHLALLALLLPAAALAHTDDEPNAAWYRSLMVSNGSFSMISCCDVSDCKPANERGDHEVYISKEVFGDKAPDAWLHVAGAAVLHGYTNPTGRAVVCFSQGRILCYVPGPGL